MPGPPLGPLPGPLPAGSPEGALLNGLLNPLMDDFSNWLQRGLVLLQHCPEAVMPATERQALADSLEQALKDVAAARALRAAVSTPMALDMDVLAPWHQLVLRVWTLAGLLRQAGIVVPAAS
ncbi:DUF2605 family protein [Synechococcus sp. CS-1328]|uniref:DUF2605 family protein n=1 Tax=Synechococcus sp. CS-1328 TaxID=2847976 RepID=UPI0028809C73|nr:DUF2605 family protein [Synechococcus sp. CS-1328]